VPDALQASSVTADPPTAAASRARPGACDRGRFLRLFTAARPRRQPAQAGLMLLPLTAGIVCGAAFTGRMIVRTGRPTDIPKLGLVLAAASLGALAPAPADRHLLLGLGLSTGLGLGSVMSVMQIATQSEAGPTRLGAAAGTISLARTLGSSLGASAFGGLICGSIGGTLDAAALHDPHMLGRVQATFRLAFVGAALLCLCAAWTASRLPTLRFDEESGRAGAIGE
jgi:MFS family permease